MDKTVKKTGIGKKIATFVFLAGVGAVGIGFLGIGTVAFASFSNYLETRESFKRSPEESAAVVKQTRDRVYLGACAGYQRFSTFGRWISTDFWWCEEYLDRMPPLGNS